MTVPSLELWKHKQRPQVAGSGSAESVRTWSLFVSHPRRTLELTGSLWPGLSRGRPSQRVSRLLGLVRGPRPLLSVPFP